MEDKMKGVEWVTQAESERLIGLQLLSADGKGVSEKELLWVNDWVAQARMRIAFIELMLSGDARFVVEPEEDGELDIKFFPADEEWKKHANTQLREWEQRIQKQ